MRKNLTVEREYEREIIDHAQFLRDQEEAARIDMEMECECGDWDEDCELTQEDKQLMDDFLVEEVVRDVWSAAYDCLGRRLDSYM